MKDDIDEDGMFAIRMVVALMTVVAFGGAAFAAIASGCGHSDMLKVADAAAPVLMQHAKDLGTEFEGEIVCWPIPESELPDGIGEGGWALCAVPEVSEPLPQPIPE